MSEYNKPNALLLNKIRNEFPNNAATIIPINGTADTNANIIPTITEIMSAIIKYAMIFKIPISLISEKTSLKANAAPKLSYLANLQRAT